MRTSEINTAFSLAKQVVAAWELDPLYKLTQQFGVPEPNEVFIARALLTFQNKDVEYGGERNQSSDLRAMWQANGMPSDW